MTLKQAAPATTGVFQKMAATPPERFRDKLIRTVLAVVLFAVTLRFGGAWKPWLHDGLLVTAALVVSGEWFLFPLRAAFALLRDVPPILAALRKAITGKNGA